MKHFLRAGIAPVVCAAVSYGVSMGGGAVALAAEPVLVVTEADLLARLDRESPAVAAASSALPLARAELVRARTLENPIIEVVREDPDGAVEQTEWLLSWQPPGPARRLEIEAAERDVEAAAARVDASLRSIRVAARADYALWAVAARRRALLDESARGLERLAVREEARAERGEASGLEARRLRLAVESFGARRALAAADERAAEAAVLRWWPDLPTDARPELPRLPAPMSGLDTPTDPGDHPAIVARRAEAEAAELQLEASRRFLTAPVVTVGWQRQEVPDDVLGDDAGGPVVGLSWTVPLFDRRRADREAAMARRDAARAEVELTVRETTARRRAAAVRSASLLAEATAAEHALDGGSEMLTAAETAFRYGELELTDLLEVQRAVTDARITWLELHAAALEARRELDALVRPASSGPASSSPASSTSESTASPAEDL